MIIFLWLFVLACAVNNFCGDDVEMDFNPSDMNVPELPAGLQSLEVENDAIEDENLTVQDLAAIQIKLLTAEDMASREGTIVLGLPYIGGLRFQRLPGNDRSYKAAFPATKKKLTIGALKLSNGEFTIAQGLGYTADAELFGKKARVGLRDAIFERKTGSYKKLTLGITFIDKPTVKLYGDLAAHLVDADLILERNKTPYVLATVTIDGSNGKLGLRLLDKKLRMILHIDRINVGTILKGVTTFFNPAVFTDVKFDLVAPYDGITPDPSEATGTFSGKADITLAAFGKSAPIKGIEVAGEVREKGSLELHAKISSFDIAPLGTITQAELLCKREAGKDATYSLEGIYAVDVPRLGKIPLRATINKQAEGLAVRGRLTKSTTLAGVDIKELEIDYSRPTDDQTARVATMSASFGTVSLLGLFKAAPKVTQFDLDKLTFDKISVPFDENGKLLLGEAVGAGKAQLIFAASNQKKLSLEATVNMEKNETGEVVRTISGAFGTMEVPYIGQLNDAKFNVTFLGDAIHEYGFSGRQNLKLPLLGDVAFDMGVQTSTDGVWSAYGRSHGGTQINLSMKKDQETIKTHLFLPVLNIAAISSKIGQLIDPAVLNEVAIDLSTPLENGSMVHAKTSGELSGKAHLALNIGKKKSLENAKVTGVVQEGALKDLSVTLGELTIEPLGTITQASLMLNREAGEAAQYSVQGNYTADVPQLGSLGFAVQVDVKSGDAWSASGSLLKPVYIKQFGQITNATLSGEVDKSTNTRVVEISTALKYKGLDTNLIARHGAGDAAKAWSVGFRVNGEWRPFRRSNVPYIANMGISDVEFAVSKADEDLASVQGTGTTTLFGPPLEVRINMSTGGDGNDAIMVRADLPEDWKASRISNGFAFLDALPLRNLSIVATNQAFTAERDKDPISGTSGVSYQPGLTLGAGITLSGPLRPAGEMLGIGATQVLRLAGVVSENPSVSIEIPAGSHTGNNPRLDGLSMQVEGPRLSFSLKGAMEFRPTKKDEMLRLAAEVQFKAPEALIAATLKGMWKKPFGLPGIELGNVAMNIGANPATFAVQGPSTLGATGEMKLGSNSIRFAANASSYDPTGTMMVGEVNSLTIGDLLTIPEKAGLTIPRGTIPEIGFRRVKIYLVPKTTRIGEITFQQGTSFSGEIQIGTAIRASGALAFLGTGIEGTVGCREIRSGPLLISGAGPDRIRGTADDGPMLSVSLKPTKQEVYLDGYASIQNIFHADIRALVGATHLDFKVDTKLAGVFDANLEVMATIRGRPNARVKGAFSETARAYLVSQVKRGLRIAQEETNKAIEQAEASVRSELGRAERRLNAAKADVRRAEGSLSGLKNACTRMQRDCRNWKRAIYACPSVPFTCAPYYVALGTLRATRSALIPATRQFVRLNKLAASVGLRAVGATTWATLEAFKQAFTAVLQGFAVTAVSFDGDAQRMARGILPSMSVTFVILGKDVRVSIRNVDITRPDRIIEAVVQEALVAARLQRRRRR